MPAHTKRVMLFSGGGVVAGIALWGVAWMLALGIGVHGGQLPFTAFFPWSQFLYRIALFGDHSWALGIVTFLQLPLYAAVLGAFWENRRRLLIVVVLVTLHLLAVAGCFLPQTFFESVW
jgi:hypothetical protein